MPKHRKFTPKQAAFIKWYVSAEVAGNGTEAARRAGYKGNTHTLTVIAGENLRKPYIRDEVDRLMDKALKGADITVQSVLERIHKIGLLAEAAGKFAPAVRCAELQGKYLKMWTDKIEHVETFEDMETADLGRLLSELVEGSGLDLQAILEEHAADNGNRPDPAGDETTH